MLLVSSWVRACSIELTLFTIVVSNYRLVSTDDRIPFFYGKTTFCYIHTISFLIQKQYIFDFYILDIVTIAKINLRVQVFLWHSYLTAKHVWLFCVSWGTIDFFVIGVVIYILNSFHSGFPFSVSAAILIIFRIFGNSCFGEARCYLFWALIFIKVLSIFPQALCMLDKQSATALGS